LVVLAQLQDGLDLLGGAFERDVAAVKLDGVQAEVGGTLQGLFELEFPEGVALDAEREAAEGIVLDVVSAGGGQRSEAEGRGRAGLEELPAGQGVRVRGSHRGRLLVRDRSPGDSLWRSTAGGRSQVVRGCGGLGFLLPSPASDV